MLYSTQHADEEHDSFKEQWLGAASNGASFSFPQPPLTIHPKEFVNQHFGPNSQMPNNMKFRKGTTTLAFVYKPLTEKDLGGVIIAVDSRASAGEYISSRTVMKVIDINERMVTTMAGGAADCQFWTRVVAKYCNLYQLREKAPISLRAASKYMASALYQYRGMGLSIASMVAGIDQHGPGIFMVNSEGGRVEMKLCSVGSGSLAAYGVLDTHYREEMSDEEALKLATRAIVLATYRDGGSGGYLNMVHITPKGKTRYAPSDVSELFYKFAAEKGKDVAYEPNDDD